MQAVEAKDWVHGSPELVIEVNSRSNRRLNQKPDLYLKHGAEQVWTVYPKRQTMLVATPDDLREPEKAKPSSSTESPCH